MFEDPQTSEGAPVEAVQDANDEQLHDSPGLTPSPLNQALRQMKALLPKNDLLLLELSSNQQVSFGRLASALRCNRGTISRRVASLRRRIEHPYASIVALYSRELSSLYRQVAVRRYLWGQTKTQIARELNLQPGQVRQALDAINVWCSVRTRYRGPGPRIRRLSLSNR
jgi:DNA-directed RNA polymerase specialized sigma24 family protein